MKKLIYCAAALATALFAGSCQRELLDPAAEGNTVTYTVNMPEIATKAGESNLLVDKLVYAVYRVKNSDTSIEDAMAYLSDKCEFVYQYEQDITGTRNIVSLELINNQKYVVAFWAQKDDKWFTHTNNTTDDKGATEYKFAELGINLTNYNPNILEYDAFSGVDFIEVNGSASKNIELKRPFAQLNIATNLPKTFTAGVNTTKVTVHDVARSYNVVTNVATVDEVNPVVFEATSPLATDYPSYDKYISMNYVFVPEDRVSVAVTYEIETEAHGTVTNTIDYVPLARNYKTNIVGNLLTSKVDYDVEIKNDWGTPNNEVPVVDADNIQAILDNAVAGTTIQLKKGVNYGTLYLRPIEGGAQTKVVDWIGNNYRFETYSLFENITIVGAEGATVDAIEIEGGTYYNTEHSQSETYPVMLSLVELKNVVFDGVTFTGKGGYDPQGYGNAVNLSGNNIKVDGLTFKNCVLNNSENNARLLYKTESTTHVHNYSYNGQNYTFSPSMKDITITDCTFNGGYMGLELRETENVTITDNEFNVDDRNILLPVNTGCTYSGKITITGNVSNNAKERFVRADGTGDAAVVIKDNILNNYQGADADYIKVTNANNVTNENNVLAYTATTASELASLVNNATQNITVVFAADLEGKIELWQNAPVNVTINGNNKKYTGAIRIINIGGATDRSMTIKNVNFDGTGLSDKEGCIYTSLSVVYNGQNYNSYMANVTVEDCTFTGSGVAAIRQNNGGDINLTVKNCTVDSSMHSFLQAKNFADCLIVDNCSTSSKNGVNLNNTHDASFIGCNFNVKGYAVRIGVDDNSDSNAKTYNFTNCTLKSECQDSDDAVVIIRNTAKDATLNFVNTTLVGDPQIIGYTTATKIYGIELPQQDNEIRYTATAKVSPHGNTEDYYRWKFNANLVSNVWDDATGKGVLTFDGPVTVIGQDTFYENADDPHYLISISIPNSVTEIGKDAFSGCSNLTSVKFGSNLTTIGEGSFGGCSSLTNVVLPEGVTTIGGAAFQSCESMTSITIPAGVTSIGYSAFNISHWNFKVYCEPTTPPTVGYRPFNLWRVEIYVPSASLNDYQTAWGDLVGEVTQIKSY